MIIVLCHPRTPHRPDPRVYITSKPPRRIKQNAMHESSLGALQSLHFSPEMVSPKRHLNFYKMLRPRAKCFDGRKHVRQLICVKTSHETIHTSQCSPNLACVHLKMFLDIISQFHCVLTTLPYNETVFLSGLSQQGNRS